jgi:hypothetical protein
VRKLSRDQCIELIEPQKQRLYRIASGPFDATLGMEHVTDFSPRTLANIRYDLMIKQARVEFRGIRGTQMVDAPYGVTLLEIDQKAIIRFKMLDDGGFPSNYPTDRATDYELCLDLPGIPPAPQRLWFGYRPNKLQTKLDAVLITNTVGKRLVYEVILDEPNEGIVVLPDSGSNTPNDAQQPRRSRVRIRASEEQTEL